MLTSGEWFPNLDSAISSGDIKGFPTKKAAMEAAKKYSWSGHVVRIQRRFEKIWIVARLDFQKDLEGDISFDVLSVPLLRWETFNGIQKQPVVRFRKHSGEKS